VSDNLKILLDIDDTALIYNEKKKMYEEHPRLMELIRNHTVVLYSGNPRIEDFYLKWRTSGFIPKGSDYLPKADVFIDNDYELWLDFVQVKKCYHKIDQFLEISYLLKP
jgi:hypothetical protein